MSSLSQSKKTMNGPMTGGAGHSSVARMTAPFGQVLVSGGGGGGAGGGGTGAGAPKLNVMPPSSECERNRESPSRPRKSTVLRLSTLKKRYFTEMSILSVIACRTPAITCHAKRVSLSSRIAP